MSDWKFYLQRAKEVPPHVAVYKAIRLLGRIAVARGQRLRDGWLTTYAALVPQGAPCPLMDALDHSALVPQEVMTLAEMAFAHRFDLLGSGRVQVRHGMDCSDVLGARYTAQASPPDADGAWLAGRVVKGNLWEAQRLWNLIDRTDGYVAIDWHLDFKSGFRWTETAWYLDVPYGNHPGADIKVPWELSRMQHLPWLAQAALLTEDAAVAKRCAREYRSQILDFLATNPPRFGCNWLCPMEVGIRICNWIMAYELFRLAEVEHPTPFVDALKRAVWEHASHIAANLEWSEQPRSNHYLSDIAGLLFASAWLPASPRINAWLAFAAHEIVKETQLQFHHDGGNYEGSSGYHRLSSELVAFSAAILLGLPEKRRAAYISADFSLLKVRPPLPQLPLPLYPVPGHERVKSPLPPIFFDLMQRAACFTETLVRPDGLIHQIGDADSGRLFKLQPALERVADSTLRERIGDHTHLITALNLLTMGEVSHGSFDAAIIAALCRGNTARMEHGQEHLTFRQGTDEEFIYCQQIAAALPETSRYVLRLPLPQGQAEVLQAVGFPDFGLYVFRNAATYLGIRCFDPQALARKAPMGHTHCDNLSVELYTDNAPRISDPGSFLYTCAPKTRNTYRSEAAHFVPCLPGLAQADISDALFALTHHVVGECNVFGPLGFVGTLRAGECMVQRMVRVMSDAVEITDFSTTGPLEPPSIPQGIQVASGYGLLADTPAWNLPQERSHA